MSSLPADPVSHVMRANGLDQHVLEWLPDMSARESLAADVPRTAVLIHGYMDAAGTWDRVAPLLAALGLRVLAPDMRGFGEGPRVPSGGYYHFIDYVFDVADMIDAAASGESIALIGHSMGGNISTLYTGTFPARVSRLALLEGLGPPEFPPDAIPLRVRRWIDDVRERRARSEERPLASESEALRRLALSHADVDIEILRTRIEHLVRRGKDGSLTWAVDPLHRTVSPTAMTVAMYSSFARLVECPTLYVSGGPAGFHFPDEDERLSAFKHLSRVTIENAGHMMHWTKPRELAEILTRFVTLPRATTS